jgi:hypothetical protein
MEAADAKLDRVEQDMVLMCQVMEADGGGDEGPSQQGFAETAQSIRRVAMNSMSEGWRMRFDGHMSTIHSARP